MPRHASLGRSNPKARMRARYRENTPTAPAAQQLNVHTAPEAQQQNGHAAATATGLPNQPPALNYHPTNFINVCNVGGLTIQCDKCNASKFKKETKAFPRGNGKYKLDILPPLLPEFNAFYSGNSLPSEHFLGNLQIQLCFSNYLFWL